MITFCPKFHKCPYTGQPADSIVVENEVSPDPLRFFISSVAVKKFYSNLHYRLLVKIPVETRSKEIMDQLSKLDNPLYLVLNEGSGADVAQRVRFAQEIINLCMPTAAASAAMGAIQEYQSDKTIKSFDVAKGALWDLFVVNTNRRLSLKKGKFKTVAIMEKERIQKVYEFFFQLTEKLYRDFVTSCTAVKKNPPVKTTIKGPKNPFTEEPKAYEQVKNAAPFISKVKAEKATVPAQSPYATTGDNFYEKKQYEYEIPKSVPDLGFNHFRELGKIKKSDTSLNLDFRSNAQNVTNTTFYSLLESLPKFGSLHTVSMDISGSQNFGAVGLSYLKTGLLRVQLDSFTLKAAGCQPMNDTCVDHIVDGLEKSSKLTTFSLIAPRCPAITEYSLVSISRLAKNHKTLKRLSVDFSGNSSITDNSLAVLKKVLEDLGTLSHLVLNFDKCENVSKKAKESIRFFIRNCPNIGCYKLT